MYDVVKLLHVLAAIVFVLAHAVSAIAIFQVKMQSDRAALTATVNRSGTALIVAGIALLVLLIAGIVAGIMGGWFGGQLWLWAAIVLFVIVGGAMTPLAGTPMRGIREALGIQVGKPKPGDPPVVPKSDAELAAARAAVRPELPAVVGIVGLGLITWLMYAKPF